VEGHDSGMLAAVQQQCQPGHAAGSAVPAPACASTSLFLVPCTPLTHLLPPLPLPPPHTLQSHLECRLWNEIFVDAQQELGIPTGGLPLG
jgi:hypothetical protein